jgi:heptaprenyl diphosphate synthase
MKAGKIVTLALLTAISLVLFVVEAQIPPLVPQVPGIKMGLANIITLFILHRREFSAADAILVVIARTSLAALIIGSPSSLIFSLSGGIAAVITMLLFQRLFRSKLIPVTSVGGALAHNTAQVAVSMLVYGSRAILLYFPALILSGILSGLLVGFTVNILLKYIKKG